MELQRFAYSSWEMSLKVIRQLLGNAKMVYESHWDIPKDFWIASGQFLKASIQPLRNAQKTGSTRGKYLHWLGTMKSREMKLSTNQGKRQNYPVAIGKTVAISVHFLWSTAFLLIKKKNQRRIEKFQKHSAAPLLNYFLSFHSSFSQTKTDVTVPLKWALHIETAKKLLEIFFLLLS